MQIRILPPDEYDKLPLKVDPLSSRVVVLEDNDSKELKGYWIAQAIVHLEPVWFHDDVKNSMERLNMFIHLLAALQADGVKGYYANADRPEIADYLERLGMKLLPFVTYAGAVPPMPSEEVV